MTIEISDLPIDLSDGHTLCLKHVLDGALASIGTSKSFALEGHFRPQGLLDLHIALCYKKRPKSE